MTTRQRPRQAAGLLSWEYVIDLTQMTAGDQVETIDRLTDGRLRGRHVTVRVGSWHPYGDRVHHDFAYGLARAVAAGVDIHLEGAPWVIGNWWRTLKDLDAVATPVRRLRVVKNE